MPTLLDVASDPHYRCAETQRADPLRVDAALAALPVMNAAADLGALAGLQRDLADRTMRLLAERSVSATEALAIMRDLGIVLGSVKRHGTEPLTITPELSPALLALGWQTDLIPRDTVQHYTAWNPRGARRRRYTDDVQEQHLQDAVRTVFPQLSGSLTISAQLAELDPCDARFAPTMDALESLTVSMVSTIDEVVATVSPEFFARTLRPYYEEITVAGTTYLGPAAAQVPLWLVDLCVWAADRNGDAYRMFVLDSLPYALPSWRAFYERHKDSPSVVTRLEEAFSVDPDNADLHRSAAATARLLRTLKTFRGRHIGIARKAYSDELRLYDTGSGGAPVVLLKAILDLTRENETLVGNGYGHTARTGRMESTAS
ncbi:monodechloroaminopyrrolnitrin synthase PrnB family protein [Tsukamurella tyrosinosolvens]|uniref:monodechloroaminopyrrolnitrin synthase PrnB family protein n=1 Tax=Tsukamurella tyrosinosolvens TaxID=57704 RepID=UPI000794C748|nr:monodechloroaminopyrrolnitrin synthase PrnB family protein [Tsukamurella tyrosinosolvens]KXP04960.1 hypothetical protein AXK59_15935 [Tsukamurella tyrosinosolvens]